jgi:hypothetical protein
MSTPLKVDPGTIAQWVAAGAEFVVLNDKLEVAFLTDNLLLAVDAVQDHADWSLAVRFEEREDPEESPGMTDE